MLLEVVQCSPSTSAACCCTGGLGFVHSSKANGYTVVSAPKFIRRIPRFEGNMHECLPIFGRDGGLAIQVGTFTARLL